MRRNKEYNLNVRNANNGSQQNNSVEGLQSHTQSEMMLPQVKKGVKVAEETSTTPIMIQKEEISTIYPNINP